METGEIKAHFSVLVKLAGGCERAAEITGLSVSVISKYQRPENKTTPSFKAVVDLEIHTGTPVLTLYASQANRLAIKADGLDRSEAAAEMSKEGSEALVALLSNVCPTLQLKEVREAAVVYLKVLASLAQEHSGEVVELRRASG